MSTRRDVYQALVAMLTLALPDADVIGPDDADSLPRRADAHGRCIIGAGEPGEPEETFSPHTYWYDHEFPIELTATGTRERSAEEVLDEMLGLIGAAIVFDRVLGGLCTWLEPTAPATSDVIVLDDDRRVPGARPPRGADFSIIATYGTPNPLS
jgi:hypothetical protein